MRFLHFSPFLLFIAALGCGQHVEPANGRSSAAAGDASPCSAYFSSSEPRTSGAHADAWTEPDPELVGRVAEQLSALGPARYGVAQGDEWRNPSITVYRDHLYVRSAAVPAPTDRFLALRDLPCALASLPGEAWPYGGWVELGPPSIGAIGDLEETGARVDRVRSLLGELGLQVNEPGL
jgi:hypothetical protein